MRAVGYQTSLPIEDEAALQDITLPRPEPTGRDLLVGGEGAETAHVRGGHAGTCSRTGG